MKKLCVALAVLLMLSAVADLYAATNTNPAIPGGTSLRMKFQDVGSFFDEEGIPVPNPGGVFAPQPAGNELRNVFNVTQLFSPAGNPIPFWNTSLGQQLSGLVFDLETRYDVPTIPPYDPLNANNVYLIDHERNPATLPTGFDPTGVTGGRVVFYLDGNGTPGSITSLYDAYTTNLPTDWIENSGAPDQFPSINTDGEELWLELVFIPFPDPLPTIAPGGVIPSEGLVPDGTLMRESVVVGSTNQGQGTAYLMIVGGS